ncbi:MAG TPA: NAD(P)-binding domain-containing protein [Pseudonocardiaceae bacterium]|nr:NAD(P)-binding domain-containing protein [Pseudonocardiaceae bacterium]
MRIGIIGAGNIGGTLTRRLAASGHDVSVANSCGPQTLHDLAAQAGATAVMVTEAARDADLVVVTIPEKTFPTCRTTYSPAPVRRSSSTPATTTLSNEMVARRDRGWHAREPLGRTTAWSSGDQGVQQHLCGPLVRLWPSAGDARTHCPAGSWR